MERINGLKRDSVPFVTVAIVALNVLVFFYMEFTGNTLDTEYLYHHGAMELSAVLDGGEWYRVLTHMFMHSGFEHLANNMLMLVVSGYIVEMTLGHWKYLISYFVCGLCATLFSAGYDFYTGEYAVGVGASGAIMGIFGIYIVMSAKARKAMGRNDSAKLFVLIGLMVFGNMQEGIDWMAHFGGALSGMILGALLYHPRRVITPESYYPYSND